MHSSRQLFIAASHWDMIRHMLLKCETRTFHIGLKNLGMIPSIAHHHAVHFPADMLGKRPVIPWTAKKLEAVF